MPKKTERSAVATPQSNDNRMSQDNQILRVRALNSLCDEWAEFDDNYLIGDDGCVYRRLKSGYYRSDKKHPYQQIRNSYGTGKQHTVHIHKAVALAFLKKPDGCTDIDHINNDKTDNRAENLQWLSHRDNLIKKSKDKEAMR